MNRILLAIHAFLTPTANVDAITAQLTKAVDRLDDAREKRYEKAAQAEAVAADKVREAVAHRREAARAKRIADKLADLLS